VDSTGPAARKARQTRRRAGTVMGDVVEYHMRKLAHRRTMWWFRGEAMVAGQLVAEAELGAMIADE
jgi:3-hydroxyacyl-[acyl-carrier-protein] dehydratase